MATYYLEDSEGLRTLVDGLNQVAKAGIEIKPVLRLTVDGSAAGLLHQVLVAGGLALREAMAGEEPAPELQATPAVVKERKERKPRTPKAEKAPRKPNPTQHIAICKYCGEEFEAKRKDSTTCSKAFCQDRRRKESMAEWRARQREKGKGTAQETAERQAGAPAIPFDGEPEPLTAGD